MNTIDPDAIAQIREIGGNELLAKLIDLFVDYVSGRITAARSAMNQGDIAGVRDAVHPVKSSAANLGATHVRDLAQRIEHLARQNETAPIPSCIDDLGAAFAVARAELQKIRATLPS